MAMIEAQGWGPPQWGHPDDCDCGCRGGPSWHDLQDCWRQVAELKAIVAQVINRQLANDQATQQLVAQLVTQELDTNPATQTVIQNIVQQYITNNFVASKGVTDGSVAAPGEVGEVISSVASTVITANGTYFNTNAITLPPGDWDVSALAYLGEQTQTPTHFFTWAVAQIMDGSTVVTQNLIGSLFTPATQGLYCIGLHMLPAHLTTSVSKLLTCQTLVAALDPGIQVTAVITTRARRVR
jgi:hypothetical protein